MIFIDKTERSNESYAVSELSAGQVFFKWYTVFRGNAEYEKQ